MASAFESHQKYKVTLYKKNKIPQHALRLAVFLRIFRHRSGPCDPRLANVDSRFPYSERPSRCDLRP